MIIQLLKGSIIQGCKKKSMDSGVTAWEEMEHAINITCITDGADFILKFSELM